MAAFYKNDNGEVLKGVYTVKTPTTFLDITLSATYTYPKEGWYLFDTDQLAYAFFGITMPV